MPKYMLPYNRLPPGVGAVPASGGRGQRGRASGKAEPAEPEPWKAAIAPTAADLKSRSKSASELPEGWFDWQPREVGKGGDDVLWRVCWRQRGAGALEIFQTNVATGGQARMTLSAEGGVCFSPDVTQSTHLPRVLQTMPSGETFALAQLAGGGTDNRYRNTLSWLSC